MGGCLGDQNYVSCPTCGHIFPRAQMTSHVCQRGRRRNESQWNSNKQAQNNPNVTSISPYFPPIQDPLEPSLYHGQARQIPNDRLDVKVAANPERTIFKWIKQPTYYYPPQIKNFSPEQMKYRTFQQKMLWFRLNIEGLRVSWEHGHEKLVINRGKLLTSCRVGVQKVNWRKEVKIIFDDEEVEDAGGVIREWMNLVNKEIFHPKTGVFELCNTDETAYKFVWDKDLNENFSLNIAWVLGVIVGKALFDRISIECHLNRTILRQLSSPMVFIHDIYSYDKDLFNSWYQILKEDGAQNLFMNMTEMKVHKDGTMQDISLFPNGSQIQVTDQNKKQYIKALIQLHARLSCKKQVQAFQNGVYRVVPAHFLSIFEPHQLEILLCGPQTIDVEDWRKNTVYKGYKQNDQIIQWFWSTIKQYNQKQLTNLLHYCTGSTRVPILGFKYLESNRNNVARFNIQKVKFTHVNPYPKSYTCFNRLQLPTYSSKQELEKYMNVIVREELNHFGLQ